MKQIVKDLGWCRTLEVYPQLPTDTPDEDVSWQGRVEVVPVLAEDSGRLIGYGVRISYAVDVMTRELSEGVAKAIARCWQWIDGQNGVATKSTPPPIVKRTVHPAGERKSEAEFSGPFRI